MMSDGTKKTFPRDSAKGPLDLIIFEKRQRTSDHNQWQLKTGYKTQNMQLKREYNRLDRLPDLQSDQYPPLIVMNNNGQYPTYIR